MNQKQRNRIENALSIVQDIIDEEQEKQSNLECNNMEHLPSYEVICEDLDTLTELEDLFNNIIYK